MRIGLPELEPVDNRVFLRVGVVGLTTSHFMETGFFVEASGGDIGLPDFEKHCVAVGVGGFAEESRKELVPQPCSLRGLSYCNVFQFPFRRNVVRDQEPQNFSRPIRLSDQQKSARTFRKKKTRVVTFRPMGRSR